MILLPLFHQLLTYIPQGLAANVSWVELSIFIENPQYKLSIGTRLVLVTMKELRIFGYFALKELRIFGYSP